MRSGAGIVAHSSRAPQPLLQVTAVHGATFARRAGTVTTGRGEDLHPSSVRASVERACVRALPQRTSASWTCRQ
jgi:hypothetical protein